MALAVLATACACILAAGTARAQTANPTFALGVTASPVVNTVSVGSGGPCLTPALTCVNVPFTLVRADTIGLRAVSVTFQLDPVRLRLCTPATPAGSVHAGTWASTFANRTLQVIDLGGGRYTVDHVLLGSACGATTGGTVFTLDVAALGVAGAGSITVTRVVLRDCANVPVDVVAGAPGSVGVLAAAIAMTPATLPPGVKYEDYSQLISATGGVAPRAFALSSGALPPGLTLSPTGLLSGTCTQQGTFAFTLLATEASGCSGTRAFSVTVSCPAIAVGPAFLPDGSVGTPYAAAVTASGGVAPYTFSALPGTLPAGVTLSPTGQLSGTPTTAATSTFAITATDAGGCAGTANYTVDVFAAPPNSFVAPTAAGLAISAAHACVAVPMVLTRGESAAARGLVVSFQLDPARLALCSTPVASIHLGSLFNDFTNTNLAVTDNGGGSYTVTVSLVGAPCGITTGGTPFTVDLKSVGPDGQGLITVTRVKATSCDGAPLAVAPGAVGSLRIQNTPITLSPANLPDGVAGTAFSQTITALSGVAPFAYSVSAGALPAGLTLTGGGVLSGTPTTSGSFSFTILTADVAGVPGSRAYTLSVLPGAPVALAWTMAPGNAVAGVAIAPAVQVRVNDALGNAVPGQAVALTLVGSGTLSGGDPVISDANGFATFATLSVNLVGTKQLRASSGVLPAVTTPTFTVSPAAPAGLMFTVGPSNAVAGTLISPAVKVKVTDAFGNPIAGSSVSLTLVGSGTLSGGGAVLSDAAGLATFSALSVNLTGIKRLTAASGTLPTITSTTFTIPSAAAATLVYAVAPGNVIAGVAMAPAVQVKVSDAFGNAVAGKSVSLALVGSGTLSGGGAVASDAAGLATFSGLSVNLAGAKQLTASSNPLPSVTSAAFTVACPAITVQQPALPDARRGTAYAQSYAAAGGSGPYTYSLSAGVLPAGLTLSSAGSLSGTPTATGTFSFIVSATDASGCSGIVTSTLSVFVDPAISHILPVTSGLCVSSSRPCVTVPFVYERGDTAATRTAHVVFQLDPRFALCTPVTPATSIRAGSWLAAFTNTTFQVTDNGGGSYTVDLGLTGLPCGQTAGGTLFTVDVAGTGADGVGNLTVTTCRTYDCANLPLPAQPGAPAPLSMNRVAPSRISDLVSTQVVPAVSGASTDSLTTIRLTWTPKSGASVSVYRASFGSYPRYDDVGGTPPDSAAAPGAPWVLVSASAATPFSDRPPVRGSWHYVAFATDSCGNRSAVSNMTRGSLDYILGDVSNKVTNGVGNNRVGVEDISLLGSRYGMTAVQILSANLFYLDVGPTVDGSVNSRPTTDNVINFEDLAIFSLNFKITPAGTSARPAAPQVAGDPRESFDLRAPALVGPSAEVAAVLHLDAAGAMQAFSVQLEWNPGVVQPMDVVSAGYIEAQGGIVLSARGGGVDAALLGVRDHGMLGSGDVATLHFRVLRAGDPGLRIGPIIARDASNRPVDPARIGGGLIESAPAQTLLLAPSPNPARDAATLAFGLSQGGSAELSIYAVDGRRVRTLVHGPRDAGVYRITWRGDDDGGHTQGPGIYWARLIAEGRTFTRRIVFLK